MTNKERIKKIGKCCKKLYVYSLPYFFIMFLATYALLFLLRAICGPWLYFVLAVSTVGFDMWDDRDSLISNFRDMTLISIFAWLLFMGISFIIHLPIIGEGIMLIISLLGAFYAFVQYNQDTWERRQLKYLI